MEELSIRIKIGDREIPMRVEASEEELVRTAGRQVNERMKTFRDQFGIADTELILSMVSFDCMVDKRRTEALKELEVEKIESKLKNLELLIAEALKV